MVVFLLCLAGLLACLQAAEPPLSRGFVHFYNLEYDAAIEEFSKRIEAAPDNPAVRNYLAQALLYREMYLSGALETELVSGTNPFLRRAKMEPSPEAVQKFHEAIEKSIELSNRALRENPDDLEALYTLGVAHGLRANYNFLVRKAYIESLRDATQARKLHNRINHLDPAYGDARLVQGIHDYVVGSLPWYLKALGFLAGFRGDKEAGIKLLEYVAAHGNVNRVDAEVLLCAVYRRERDPEKAVPLLESLIERYPRNYLFRFELAQMYSDLGDKASALAAVRRIEELKSSGYPGYERVKLEKIYYARGTIQFWYREFDEALENMKKVTARAGELDLNTGTFAWLRLGQIYDMKGERSQALEAYRQAINLAPNSDAARQSRQFLSTPYRRESAKS